jgi:hypothetical protein
MDINKLKSRASAIDKLVQAAAQDGEKKKGGADDRFWKPSVDQEKNGYAVIRFLPGDEGDDLPWARFWDHGFQGPTGQWLFEKSLTSLGQDCPISEFNSQLWSTGNKEDQAQVRKQKRRLHYVANILVISDPQAPQNEGKVFLYDFGKKIFDKINDAMQPQFKDEKAINPFDLWEGADFAIKIRQVEGYRNYDKSEFKSQSALFDGDEEQLQAVASQIRPLGEFTDPTKGGYKTYEQLQARLNAVMGLNPATQNTNAQTSLDVQEEAPQHKEAAAPAPAKEVQTDDIPFDTEDADEGDALSYFQKIAQEG